MDELEHKHKIDDEMGTGGHGSTGGDSDHNTSKGGASKHIKVGGEGAVEDMLGDLKCPVCLKIMHKPVALVPCMHNLCAGCLVSCQENAQGKTCQICRATVAGSGRNHALANIIDKFLDTCPQHQREAEDIHELDERVAAKEAATTAGTKGAPAANRGPCTVCGNLISLDDAQIRDADGRYSHEACAVMDEVSSEEEENEDEVSSHGEEEEIGLWLCTLKGHSGGVSSVAWNKDGTLLASGSWDKTVKIWDMSSGSLVEKCTLRGHSNWVASVAWSPDGKTLASGSADKTVRLWDVESGEEKGTLKGHVSSWQQLDAGIKALATKVKEGGSAGDNRSGQYIVTGEGDMVYVYLATSEGEKHGESLAAFRSPSQVMNVCCRGTCVVAGCYDGQVRLECAGRVPATARAHFPRLYCTRAA